MDELSVDDVEVPHGIFPLTQGLRLGLRGKGTREDAAVVVPCQTCATNSNTRNDESHQSLLPFRLELSQ